MASPTQLTTKDKEAVLKMAGIEVRRNKFGNWEALNPNDDRLFMTTAFYESTIDLVFEQLTCPK